jgi:hypothetical protein
MQQRLLRLPWPAEGPQQVSCGQQQPVPQRAEPASAASPPPSSHLAAAQSQGFTQRRLPKEALTLCCLATAAFSTRFRSFRTPLSVSVLSESQEHALLVTAVGVPDTVHEGNRLLKVPGSASSVERILQKAADFFYWSPSTSEGPAPSDWSTLASAAGPSRERRCAARRPCRACMCHSRGVLLPARALSVWAARSWGSGAGPMMCGGRDSAGGVRAAGA